MTFDAQLVLRTDDHPRVVRPMGIMTIQAILPLERFMIRSSCGLRHKFLVTVGTKNFHGHLEEIRFIRGMGIVACVTFPGAYRFMRIRS